ncbi:hypothetical protein [Cribrihabitans neustonicus]|uniref:hypothetical protein n=1 Tax=Cribrihabitans neustonicus TaxID=1429085 RepID=UPI003B590182
MKSAKYSYVLSISVPWKNMGVNLSAKPLIFMVETEIGELLRKMLGDSHSGTAQDAVPGAAGGGGEVRLLCRQRGGHRDDDDGSASVR